MTNKDQHHRRARPRAASAKGPCHFFAQHGRCKYGDTCKFSHEAEVVKAYRNASQLDHSQAQPGSNAEVSLDCMHFLRSPRPLRPFQCRQVFLDAVKKLNSGDATQSQNLIDALARDNGLQHIRRILESPMSYNGSHLHDNQGLTFLRHAVPFLEVLAHRELQTSMVMEKDVGTIFNVVYGPGNGERAVGFFNSVLGHLETMVQDSQQSNDQFAAAYGHTASAILSVVRLNTGALVKKEFQEYAERLDLLAISAELFNDDNHLDVRRDLLSLGKRLKVGDMLSAALQLESKKSKTTSSGADGQAPYQRYTQDVDFPGKLSTTGPRHNNDHSAFEHIQILPTADEIATSDRPEFLPVADPDAPHFLEDVPTARLLDSQFRLLREDNIGPIRDALRNLLELDEDNRKAGRKLAEKVTLGGTKVFVHQNVRIEGLTFHPFKGLQICVGFAQPKCLQNKKKEDRRAWWETAFSFDRGALVCYIDEVRRCTLLVVSERIVTAKPRRAEANSDQQEERAIDPMDETDLASDPDSAVIRLAFPESASADEISWLREQLSSSKYTQTGGLGGVQSYLVEFPKVLLASFKPVLGCLQKNAARDEPMPFDQWLVPGGLPQVPYTSTDGKEATVPPPTYARRADFSFNLQCLQKPGTAGAPLNLYPGKADQFDLNALKERTTLDEGQCAALVAGLSKELALIQGPPGTGKSYVGVQLIKVLVANKISTKITMRSLGPIVCVCFTNHALDQLLEDLLDGGISSIIRIGTRSKSERVSALSLDNHQGNPTKHEDYERRKTRAQLFEKRDEASTACANIFSGGGKIHWKGLMKFLKTNYPHIHDQIDSSVDEDGFERVSSERRSSPIETWLHDKFAPRLPYEIRAFNFDALTAEDTSVWRLYAEQRRFLVERWLEELEEMSEDDLRRLVFEHSTTIVQLDRVQHEVQRRQLDNCNVIGVTTSGFAKNIDLLRSLNAKVLLSEEAGEILEAHTLTNLLPSLEHVILIGDHLQLRPKANNYDLSIESRQGRRYSLDVSLFERLTRATFGADGLKFPTVALNIQRRMHPSIARLVRYTLYPTLQDHPDVLGYAPIAGMRRRLFWFDHRQPETEGNDPSQLIQTSYTNKFEQEMVMALSRHLLRQGNLGTKGLAIITPYVGQLLRFKRLMASSYEVVVGDKDQELLDEQLMNEDSDELPSPKADENVNHLLSPTNVRKTKLSHSIRLATVDNFQGEEADIIIVSLVRSNRNNNCGFLKTRNRINVLLSRARRGMYIIGNSQTYTAGSSEMWEDVVQILEQGENIGPKLELECPRHKDKEIFVKNAEDFTIFSPEGGCDERCNLRLNCGHTCHSKCHAPALHGLVPCDEPCNKLLVGCTHPCESTCGAPCGKCQKPILNIILPCQHVVKTMPCHQAQHIENYKCTAKVTKTVPGCGHAVKTTCCTDVASPSYRCHKPCGLPISTCGHECKKPCHQCRTKNGDKTIVDHGTCQKICERPFNNCNHSCRRPCHAAEGSECGVCMEPCVIECGHSRCPKKCSEPCAPCAEPCCFGCVHQGRCELPCACPCEVLPCNERCTQVLLCLHRCPSLCGEKCPDVSYCQKCASQDVLDSQVDFLMFENYRDLDLDESPIVLLACGHFFTFETLDGIMELGDVYILDQDGRKIVGIRKDAWDHRIDKVNGCPTCRTPISNVRRYSYIQKRAQIQIATRKFITHSHRTFLELESELGASEMGLEETRPSRAVKDGLDGYQDIHRLITRIDRYTRSVAEVEQPFHRVYDLAVAAKQRGQVETADLPEGGIAGTVQFKFWLQGMCLALRAKTAIACDRDMLLDAERKAISLRGGDDEEKIKVRQALEIRIHRSVAPVLGSGGKVIAESIKRSHPASEIEARIYVARFSILRLKHDERFSEPAEAEKFRSEILQGLDACESTMKNHPGTTGHLAKEVESARKALQEKEFYSTVTDEERRAVYQAMAAGFSGTGHWYYCQQGHPYTIGECGMAMQTARCPECGGPVGGSNHSLLPTSRRADDMEAFAMHR